MKFKLIVIMVEDQRTNDVIDAAREAGATGCTVLNQARGEGVNPQPTFLGLSMDTQVDVVLLLAEEHMCRKILDEVARAGEFDETSGTGIAIQVDVEDAIGVRHQIEVLSQYFED
jgi:uncharacterized protein YaaQ